VPEPMPKMSIALAFCAVLILRCRIMGIGSIRSMTSVIILDIGDKIYRALVFRYCPSSCGLYALAGGRQWM
jgi:hypothetical protein